MSDRPKCPSCLGARNKSEKVAQSCFSCGGTGWSYDYSTNRRIP